MKEIVAYLRYSDHKQDDGFSIEYQTTEVEDYAASKGVEIDRYYIDKAQTATKVAGREEFFALIRDVKAGKIKTVIVYKLSRMFRNALESSNYRDLFREKGVKLMAVTQYVDEDTSSGRLTTNILASIDQYSSENTSDHVKSSMREMARQCLYTGGIVKYGYTLKETKNGKKTRSTFVLHPSEAEVVKRIFQLYLDGLSLAAICRILNSENVPTRNNALWSSTQITRILTDDMYIGTYRFKTKGYDDIVIEDGVPPIVDKVLFYAVGDLKEEKTKSIVPRGRHNSTIYGLTGKAICGKCGEHFTGYSNHMNNATERKKYSYYVCRSRRRFSRCDAIYQNKEHVEDAVLNAIKTHILNDEKIEEIAEKVAEICQKSPSDLADQIKKTTKEKKSLERRVENLVDALANGESPTIMKKINAMEKEVKELEKKIYILNERKKNEITVDSIVSQMNGMLDKANSGNDEILKSVFDTFVQEVIISDDKIEITLNAFAAAPADTLFKPVKHISTSN